MSRAVQVHAKIHNLIAPYAPEHVRKAAGPHDLLSQVETGAQGLAARVSRWAPLLPDAADLAEAERTAQGLARLLRELSEHVTAEVPDDAA